MSKRISQREAHRLKRQVDRWEHFWTNLQYAPSNLGPEVDAGKFEKHGSVHTALKVSRQLGHPITATVDSEGRVSFLAIRKGVE